MKRLVIDLENGTTTEIDMTPEEIAEMTRNISVPSYRELRLTEYPSFADQFDLLYHGGYDAWRSAIQAVKDKYPKGDA